MKQLAAGVWIVTSLFVATTRARCEPVFASAKVFNGVTVYADSQSSTTFYYAPGKLAIAQDKNGQPEISFLQMRYTGTAATGDQGQFRTRSILSFRVLMTAPGSLSAARAAMKAAKLNVRQLRPLSIRRMETHLNYTPLAPSTPMADTAVESAEKPIGAGDLQAGDKAPAADEYWTERTYTLSPDDATSQALWEAFQSGKVLLSLSYAFFADGIPADTTPIISGNVKIPGLLDDKDKTQSNTQLIAADAVAITVDAKNYPDRFKKIDINDSVPASYAVLSVYCFDFNNALRPDLYEKSVEIQATSVTGKPLRKTVSFSKTTPDLYSSAVKFQFAVSLRDPYKFRIHEINNDGEEKISSWQTGKPWSQMLDVTTPEAERPKPAPSTPDEDSADGETP
jgi:hypothetical protein